MHLVCLNLNLVLYFLQCSGLGNSIQLLVTINPFNCCTPSQVSLGSVQRGARPVYRWHGGIEPRGGACGRGGRGWISRTCDGRGCPGSQCWCCPSTRTRAGVCTSSVGPAAVPCRPSARVALRVRPLCHHAVCTVSYLEEHVRSVRPIGVIAYDDEHLFLESSWRGLHRPLAARASFRRDVMTSCGPAVSCGCIAGHERARVLARGVLIGCTHRCNVLVMSDRF
jgi:hypothetical protein